MSELEKEMNELRIEIDKKVDKSQCFEYKEHEENNVNLELSIKELMSNTCKKCFSE
jgi:hypothetical protein